MATTKRLVPSLLNLEPRFSVGLDRIEMKAFKRYRAKMGASAGETIRYMVHLFLEGHSEAGGEVYLAPDAYDAAEVERKLPAAERPARPRGKRRRTSGSKISDPPDK
jgi:hypothetical protein